MVWKGVCGGRGDVVGDQEVLECDGEERKRGEGGQRVRSVTLVDVWRGSVEGGMCGKE